jgi:anti-sigma factor ChrR (cupin superfamily)
MLPQPDENYARHLEHLFTIASFQDQLPWQPFRLGIEIYPLSQNPETGYQVALLRYQAGAVVPRHYHPGYEHILVLSGTQQDEQGQYSAGEFVINAPGSRHQVTSPEGCIVLIFWEQPVVFEPAP